VNAGTLVSRTAILILAALSLTAGAAAQEAKAHFVGSESCKPCHEAEYNGWDSHDLPKQQSEIRFTQLIRDTSCAFGCRRSKDQPTWSTSHWRTSMAIQC
jgi:hypothetical protein